MVRWKLLVSLVVLTPLVAYVAGTLASGSDGPPEPTPVILEQSGGGTRGGTGPATQRPSPGPGRSNGDDGAADDDNRGGDDEDGRGEDADDGPVVVTPQPTGVERDETAGGDGDGDDAEDDDSEDDDTGDDDTGDDD